MQNFGRGRLDPHFLKGGEEEGWKGNSHYRSVTEKEHVYLVNTRRSRRIKVSLKAEHVSESTNRPVFIENISEQGMHMVTLHKSAEEQFFPGKSVQLKLRLSSGEAIPLRCQVRWMSVKTPPDGVTDSVGLEIIDPPSQYLSFVKTLD